MKNGTQKKKKPKLPESYGVQFVEYTPDGADLYEFFGCGFIFWVCVGIIPLLLGMINAQRGNTGPCGDNLTRIEYVFPQYRIGCWLNSVPGK